MKTPKLLRCLSILILIFSACRVTDAEIKITGAWARPGFAGENSAVYLEITSLEADDYLIQVETASASVTELHRSVKKDDGTIGMHHQIQIELPANQPVEFSPGGLHIMLMGLSADLMSGDELKLTLVFKNQGEVVIDVPVTAP